MEQRDEEMGRREENRGPERASESEEIDRTLEQIMDNQKQEKKKRPGLCSFGYRPKEPG